jgi:hypothetical protein
VAAFFSRKTFDNPVNTMRTMLTTINDGLNKIVNRKLLGPQTTVKPNMPKNTFMKYSVEL